MLDPSDIRNTVEQQVSKARSKSIDAIDGAKEVSGSFAQRTDVVSSLCLALNVKADLPMIDKICLREVSDVMVYFS